MSSFLIDLKINNQQFFNVVFSNCMIKAAPLFEVTAIVLFIA